MPVHIQLNILQPNCESSGEVLEHPPYNPDLAPSDYYLFMHTKKWLGSKCLGNDEELTTRIVGGLWSQATKFYNCGISKLLKCCGKCLNVAGHYAYFLRIVKQIL